MIQKFKMKHLMKESYKRMTDSAEWCRKGFNIRGNILATENQ